MSGIRTTRVKKPTKSGDKFYDKVKPETKLRIIEAAKMLSQGKSRATIIEHLSEKYDIEYNTAADYYCNAALYLVPEDGDAFRKNLIRQNAVRLEAIYERAMENGDLKNAKEAISELNKMCGLTGNGLQVAVNNDVENNAQQIFIKFDN